MSIYKTKSNCPNRRLFAILLSISFLLLVFILLQLIIGSGVDGQGFNWTFSDFVIAGILLFSAGLLSEFVLRKVKDVRKRILICAVILVLLLLIWADLAVGIFNIPGFSGS